MPQAASQPTKLSRCDARILENIQSEGVALTSLAALNLEMTGEFQSAAARSVAILARRPAQPDTPNDPDSAFSHCTIHDPRDVARDLPELYLWFLQDRWLDLMEHIVGGPVISKGINIRKDVPVESQTGTRVWHVDSEDLRVGKIIVYLRDVGSNDGPFEYISRRETRALGPDRATMNDSEMAALIPQSRWRACPGAAGTVIVADTASVLHHGRSPEEYRFSAIASYVSRSPVNPELCRKAAFRRALPLMAHRLNARQRASILSFDELLS